MLIYICQNVTYIRRGVIVHVQTHTHTHTHRHHSPFRLSFWIIWMSSSVVDALYYIRCTHLTTGGVFQMPSWDLGLSPCHFLTRKVEVSGIGTASHAHTHTHTHTRKCKQVSCNTHLHLPKFYVHTHSNCTCTDTHTHTHICTHTGTTLPAVCLLGLFG